MKYHTLTVYSQSNKTSTQEKHLMLLRNQYRNKANPKVTVTQPQNHTNANTNEHQGNVYIIMDSNEENPKGSITLITCENVNSAESILKSLEIVALIKILLHIGVNDIYEQHPRDLAFNLRNLTERFHWKFKSQVVFLSDVTPREEYFEGHVHAVNQELTEKPRNTHIKRVDHKIWNRVTYTMIDTYEEEIKYKRKQYQQTNFLQKEFTKKCQTHV